MSSNPGLGRFLEDGRATHFSIFAWRIRGQRSLVGYSPWVAKRRTQLKRLRMHIYNVVFIPAVRQK